MATKSSRHASADSASDSAAGLLGPLNALSEVTRQQLSLMTQAACAVLGSSEAIGKIQQHAAHQASLRHEAAAESLRGDVEPLDVLAIQSDLLRQDMQEAAQYWTQLATTAMKSQLDMMGRMTDVLNTGSQSGLSTALDAWRTAVAPHDTGSRAGVH
jgi:hypothetical protein